MSAPRAASAAELATRAPIALAGLLEAGAFGCGKQDVPGGDGFDAGVAQARGDGLAGFAEADEAQTGGVAVRHGAVLRVELELQSIAERMCGFQHARLVLRLALHMALPGYAICLIIRQMPSA